MSGPTALKASLLDPHVCVIGAGTMGRGIAQIAVAAGHAVSLVDPDAGQLQAAVADIRSRLNRKHPELATDLETRLLCAKSIDAVPAAADTLVVEAVVEDLAVKATVFAQAWDHFGPGCLLATNTSSLSITEIAAATADPTRVVGLHFFNPVPVMRLVEVIRGLDTDQEVVARVAALARSWGKEVAHVRSAPGFIVNRVARPFYGESLRLLEEQTASAEIIDEVLRGAGQFRMGPFELMDLIGNDVNFTVTSTVWRAFNFDARYAPSQLQAELVAAGRLGRKSGRGFYRYDLDADRPQPPPATSRADCPERVVMHGDSPQLAALLERAGITPQAGETGQTPSVEFPGQGMVVVTRGCTAQLESSSLGAPVAVLDLCLDPSTVDRLALASTDPDLLASLVALLSRAGVAAFPIADAPGLIVARVMSMIANEAWEAAHQGIATTEDIDSAMILGTNYPMGPFRWSEEWTPAVVLQVLDELATEYRDPRYRPSIRLRAAARTRTLSQSARSSAVSTGL
ncbi:3-hydroxybutyryl-CoA dehydrogenase [Kribbella sp. VKM Ac-2527]|uniref:3-hydroxybutyryl-CoA dehydrogenase n=1 Tax=Kribbella caucasensis TaxID=2512215 RepID=A0A4R6KKU3_9ACTN|nr:3-hydroxyacyl-CoA dehydrogenase [Kribbella sp. VKM Ac-2527]TDO51611.1 3-hydroxybutyryl-CoA dehydrogenase [Kribbella sp. VKM Ac-2527]